MRLLEWWSNELGRLPPQQDNNLTEKIISNIHHLKSLESDLRVYRAKEKHSFKKIYKISVRTAKICGVRDMPAASPSPPQLPAVEALPRVRAAKAPFPLRPQHGAVV